MRGLGAIAPRSTPRRDDERSVTGHLADGVRGLGAGGLAQRCRLGGTAPGQGHESLLQPSPGDLEVTERDATADQVADGGVGIQRVDRDARAADVDLGDALELGKLRAVRPVGDEAKPPGGHRRFEGGAGAVCHDLAVVEHDDAVGDLVCLGQMVRGEEHCAALVPEVPHHSPEALAGLHVHGGGRLVEEHDLGVASDRDGEADPLGLAAREAIGPAAQERTDVRALDDLVKRRRPGVQAPDQAEGLVDSDAGGRPMPEPDWSIAPTRPSATDWRGSLPRTSTRPSCGRTRPSSAEMVVDLPAPFGPRSASTSPWSTSRSSRSRAIRGP